MINKDIKIAFFDIDGTLVSFNSHKVPDSALTALNTMAECGVEIVIATGRGAEPLAEIKDVPYSAIIGLNGAECALRDDTLLYRHSIPKDLFERVLEMGSQYDFAVAAKFKEGFVVDRVTPQVEEMAARIASPCPPVRNLRELFNIEGTGQMCIYADTDTERKVMPGLSGLTSSRWCEVFADINLAGLDKGTGVRDYIALRGFSKEEAISFGDGGNDIPMFRATEISVAMGNALDSVKKEASYITADIDNDGLLQALRHFRLA